VDKVWLSMALMGMTMNGTVLFRGDHDCRPSLEVALRGEYHGPALEEQGGGVLYGMAKLRWR